MWGEPMRPIIELCTVGVDLRRATRGAGGFPRKPRAAPREREAATLTKILTYHVVPGKISSKELKKWIKKGGGTYSAKTVEGGSLTFTEDMGKIKITDEKGGTAWITTADVFQSNGVIHVIDSVLMPS